MNVPFQKNRKDSRAGAAAIIALVLLAVLGLCSAVLLQDLFTDRLLQLQTERRAQSQIFLDDFETRTRSRLQTDADFPGEEIRIPPLSARHGGTFTLSSHPEKEQPRLQPRLQFRLLVEYKDENGRTLYSDTKTIPCPPISAEPSPSQPPKER